MLRTLLIGALLLIARGYEVMPGYYRLAPIHIAMKGTFSADEVRIIKEAATAWNTAIGETVLVLWSIPTTGSLMSIIRKAEILSGGAFVKASYTLPGRWLFQHAEVELTHALWGNTLYNTALHEFGHVLGLEHSTDSDIMNSHLWSDGFGGFIQKPRIALTADDVLGVLVCSTLEEMSITQPPITPRITPPPITPRITPPLSQPPRITPPLSQPPLLIQPRTVVQLLPPVQAAQPLQIVQPSPVQPQRFRAVPDSRPAGKGPNRLHNG